MITLRYAVLIRDDGTPDDARYAMRHAAACITFHICAARTARMPHASYQARDMRAAHAAF